MSARIDCEAARAGLLEGQPEALAHVADCPVCRERLDQLSAAILSDRPDELSCAELRAWMPQLLDSEASAGDTPERKRAWQHLDHCPECHEAFLAFGLAMAELASPGSPQPPRQPAVDTRFLRPVPRPFRAGRGAAIAAILVLGLGLGTCGLLLRGMAPAAPTDRDEAAASATATGRPAEPFPAAAGDSLIPPTAVARAGLATPDLRGGSPRPAGTKPVATPVASALTPATLGAASPQPSPSATATPPAPTDPPAARPEPGQDEPEPSPTPSPEMSPVCRLERYGPTGGYLDATCERFPRPLAYDLYRVDVPSASRWTFSICGRSELDTLLALYRADAFDPAQACAGLIAFDDDYCGRQSRLSLDLEAGSYLLLFAEKWGDLSADYAIQVRANASAGPQECPRLLAPAETPVPSRSPSPSTTPQVSSTAQATGTPQVTGTPQLTGTPSPGAPPTASAVAPIGATSTGPPPPGTPTP